MKPVLGVTAVLAVCLVNPTVALAADIEAGKAKAAEVCAACHGALGTSVSDTIPNLAGQKARYIEIQLKALRDGSRKNPIMSVIAKQLSDDDIANVAAHFSAQQGSAALAKSEFLPNLAAAALAFPEDYKTTYTRYDTVSFPDRKTVQIFYANEVALKAAKAGATLPDGAVIFSEVYSAKLDADKKPVTAADGQFVPDKLLAYPAMGRNTDWGKNIPAMLRNENWNYAVFTPEKKPRAGVNQAECLACHKPQAGESYLFTLKELTKVAKEK
jgi:cytochrome c553